MVNYDDRYFIGVKNYDNGDLNKETVFRYRQKNKVVWGSFEGGGAMHGNFIARVLDGDKLDMRWQYLNKQGEFRCGTCISTPETLPDGRIRLHELWKTAGAEPQEGTSVIEELPY
ncbi:MAG: n-acetylglutamate synthase [Candidatus Zixiibacteriota bacterium]|nr:MAG: n-acetylglutamate synthase [candidate division Zixibacteria bacterium]